MKLPILLAAICTLAFSSTAFGVPSEEIVLKNAGFARTISFSSGILKTIKIEAGGVQILDQPSIEFMIEISNKDEIVTLIPSDFDIKEMRKGGNDRENTVTAGLLCKRSDIPLRIEINYTAEIKSDYQQKSITFFPNKKLKNMILRRVSIDDCRFKNEYLPATMSDLVDQPDVIVDSLPKPVSFNYDKRSDFCAFDPKTTKGFYFYIAAPKSVCSFSLWHNLSICEEMEAPLDKGYETSKAIIGSITGSPDKLLMRYKLLTPPIKQAIK